MNLRCYCCGEEISPGDIYLVQYKVCPNPGRVFTLKGEHMERIEDENMDSMRVVEVK